MAKAYRLRPSMPRLHRQNARGRGGGGKIQMHTILSSSRGELWSRLQALLAKSSSGWALSLQHPLRNLTAQPVPSPTRQGSPALLLMSYRSRQRHWAIKTRDHIGFCSIKEEFEVHVNVHCPWSPHSYSFLCETR